VGAALAYALPASAAVSVQSESPTVRAVQLGAKATLDANGAVVFTPITFACTVGGTARLEVTVTQNVGDVITSGNKVTWITECTGRAQSMEVTLTPAAGQKPFRTGVAFGSVTLDVHDPTSRYGTVTDEHTIQIVKKR
jgi:hypothetical protein